MHNAEPTMEKQISNTIRKPRQGKRNGLVVKAARCSRGPISILLKLVTNLPLSVMLMDCTTYIYRERIVPNRCTAA